GDPEALAAEALGQGAHAVDRRRLDQPVRAEHLEAAAVGPADHRAANGEVGAAAFHRGAGEDAAGAAARLPLDVEDGRVLDERVGPEDSDPEVAGPADDGAVDRDVAPHALP